MRTSPHLPSLAAPRHPSLTPPVLPLLDLEHPLLVGAVRVPALRLVPNADAVQIEQGDSGNARWSAASQEVVPEHRVPRGVRDIRRRGVLYDDGEEAKRDGNRGRFDAGRADPMHVHFLRQLY